MVFSRGTFPPQELASIAPSAEKSEPSEPKTNQEQPTSEDDSATRELTVFGMSVKNYAETQVRFLEDLNSPRSKIEPWEYPFDPWDGEDR